MSGVIELCGLRIDPLAIYSREQLQAQLNGMISVETLLQGLAIQPRFRHVVLGSEIAGALLRIQHEQEARTGSESAGNACELLPIASDRTGTRPHGRPRKHLVDPLRLLTTEDLRPNTQVSKGT